MASLRFSNKGNKRYLQPPTLHSFDLLSSQDRQQQIEHEIQQLSDVQQKSFFESEPQEPDHSDIQNFLQKMKKIGDKELPPQNPRKSQRLQDQQIIVVEEENQVGSNLDNNQSVILEQLQFYNETHPENTPQWQDADEVQKSNKEEIKYVINLIGDSPNFIAKEHQNLSSSTPWDIESSQYKISQNRNSKKTCVDRVELLDSQTKIQNKSCIEKPISFDQQENKKSKKANFFGQQKNSNFQFILNKWKNQVYPLNSFPQGQTQLLRKESADFKMERDAKFCISNYKVNSSRVNIDQEQRQLAKQKEAIFGTQKSIEKKMLNINDYQSQDIQSKTSIMDRLDKEIQTKLTSKQMEAKQQKLNEEIIRLRYKNENLQNQLNKIKEKLNSQANELNKTRQSLKNKDNQLQKLKSTYLRTQVSQQQKKWGQQSRRLTSKNRQLERMINIQNQTIRQFQQKNQALQKKLNKTVSYNTFEERSPTFFGNNNQFQSVKINKNQLLSPMSQQANHHQKCKKQVEELQQYIFDLQQKFAGIDIQVQKRVRIISETIQTQISKKLSQQHKIIVNTLRQQLSKYQQAHKHLQLKYFQLLEKQQNKQQQLYQKQKQINNMYQQLKKEWKYLQKQPSNEKNFYFNQPQTGKYYSPKASVNTRFDYQKHDINPVFQSSNKSNSYLQPDYLYCSNREIRTPNFKKDGLSSTKNNLQNNTSVSYMIQQEDMSFRKGLSRLNQTQKASVSYGKLFDQNQWSKKQKPKAQYQQNNQLAAINNKIQRLRKEINKELCSIH